MDRTPGWGRNDTGGAAGPGGSGGFAAEHGGVPAQAVAGAPGGGSWPAAVEAEPAAGGYPGPAAEPDTLPSRMPAGYQLLRRIGSGRYSTVLLCREEAGGQEVALKMLHLTVEDEGLRLAAHAELLSAGAAAKHPCSVLVDDAGFTPDNRPYLAQRFCRGGNAQARLLNSGPFPVDEVIVIGIRCALSLASSHRRGVLHLDVRPANVLFDEAGDALLSDHGVARVLQRAAPQLGAVFDPMYSCREMFGWEKPGPSADVYSLGATLYALLAGLPAYAEAGGTSWSALYGEVLGGELPLPGRPDAPPQLLELIRRMMAPNPEGRPPLTEVHRVLRHLLPPGYASRVPAGDPEPAPEPVLPGWDPADDITPEEQAEAERLSREAEAEARHRNRLRTIAAVAAVAVFAGGATAITLFVHDVKHGGAGAPPSASASASPSASGTAASGAPASGTSAQQVPSGELAALMPRRVTAVKEAGGVRVAWQAPADPTAVAGYYVQATDAAGRRLALRSTSRTARELLLTGSAGASGVCYTVASEFRSPSGPQYAPAERVCS